MAQLVKWTYEGRSHDMKTWRLPVKDAKRNVGVHAFDDGEIHVRTRSDYVKRGFANVLDAMVYATRDAGYDLQDVAGYVENNA